MSDRIRVVRIIDRLNIGGPAKHVVWLTAGLDRDEFETTLVTGTVADGEGDMSDFARAAGVEPLVISEMGRELSFRDLSVMVQLWRLFRTLKPHIIHTHKSKAGAVGRWAALFYKWWTPAALWLKPRDCRIVHTFHGHTFHGYFGAARARLFLAIERLLARFCTDCIVTVCEQQRREILERYRIGRAEQFRVIPLGIDFSEGVFGNYVLDESHRRKSVDGSDPAYGTEQNTTNPTDGSRWMVQAQPSGGPTAEAGLERSPNCRWGDSKTSGRVVCRSDLNDPPTAVGGIQPNFPTASEADDRSHRVREDLGVAEGEFVIGIIGRLCEVKNHAMFLRAAAHLMRSLNGAGRPVRFVVIGDGHLRAELELLSQALGIADRVIYTGFRRDLIQSYRALDLVALTSLNEGTPLTLIEAMYCGRAVVATEVGGVIDLLGARRAPVDGFTVWDHGITSPSRDDETFARALRYLIARPELCREMGARGRRFVEKHLSKDRLVRDIEQLYRDLRGFAG